MNGVGTSPAGFAGGGRQDETATSKSGSITDLDAESREIAVLGNLTRSQCSLHPGA